MSRNEALLREAQQDAKRPMWQRIQDVTCSETMAEEVFERCDRLADALAESDARAEAWCEKFQNACKERDEAIWKNYLLHYRNMDAALAEENLQLKAKLAASEARVRRVAIEVRKACVAASMRRWKDEPHITTRNGLSHGCIASAKACDAVDIDAILAAEEDGR